MEGAWRRRGRSFRNDTKYNQTYLFFKLCPFKSLDLPRSATIPGSVCTGTHCNAACTPRPPLLVLLLPPLPCHQLTVAKWHFVCMIPVLTAAALHCRTSHRDCLIQCCLLVPPHCHLRRCCHAAPISDIASLHQSCTALPSRHVVCSCMF